MKTSKRVIIYAAFALLLVISLVIYTTTSPNGAVVVIKSDGKEIQKIDLKTVTEEYEFTVENSGYNKIKISREDAKVYEADCPDKLCIEQSKKGIYPIICLPNKLVIEKR